MFSFQKPSTESIRRFLSEQDKLELTYSAVGATAGTPPSGFNVDHIRIKLGNGKQVFESARAAIMSWKHFQLGWVESSSKVIPIEVGQVVGVLARVCCIWCLNACRIVSVIEDVGATSRYGFVYGTLGGHVESGEERFQVEWNHKDDSVWYDIFAFSRPHHFLTRLGYPIARRIQKKFARDSAAAMHRAVQPVTSLLPGTF